MGTRETRRALITGATGFIGGQLLARCEHPVVLSRDADRARSRLGAAGAGASFFSWQVAAGPPPAAALRDIEVVFHLAGESVAGGRWTPARKERIRRSRVLGTRHLVEGLAAAAREARPRVLVSASAVGFYGERGDEIVDETSAPGSGFMAELCRDWEAAAMRAADLGLRVVTVRIGVVLHRRHGAMARILPPFALCLGGRLGTGRQWMPWVHYRDAIGLLLHAAAAPTVAGPMNAVAPAIVTNREFTRILAHALRRPALLPVPVWALRLALGEMADVVLTSQRVEPRVARESGYRFRYPELDAALRAVLGGDDRREAAAASGGGR